MRNAEFLIDGTPFSQRGYDAAPGTTVKLKLAKTPAPDIGHCQYIVVKRNIGIAAPVLLDSGIATPPTAEVDLTVGNDPAIYLVRCVTNGGNPGPDGSKDYNVLDRMIVVRTSLTSLRMILAAERNEYLPGEGWAEAHNEVVRAVEALKAVVNAIGWDLSAGIVFGATDLFSITQTAPAEGVAPAMATIRAPAAHAGDAMHGAKLRVGGGAPGTAEQRTGDTEVELGDEDLSDQETGKLVLRMGGVAGIYMFGTTGEALIAAPSRPLGIAGTALSLSQSGGMGSSGGIYLSSGNILFSANKLDLGATPLIDLQGAHLKQGYRAVGMNGAGAVLNFDVYGPKFELTLNLNSTLDTPTGIIAGAEYRLKIKQGATPRTLGFNATWKFGTADPTVSAVANAIDIYTFEGDTGPVLRLVSMQKRVES